MTDLVAGWVHAIAALSPTANLVQTRRHGEELLQRWDEDHRSYHTRRHLAEMLVALDHLDDALRPTERAVATVTAWLHDAVYDVTSATGTGEHASADLAVAILTGLGCADDAVSVVEQLILMTITHDGRSPNALEDVVHDADLWILGAPKPRFRQYCDQVRTEYRHVPDMAYAEGRTGILRALVDRDEIYRTARARDEWTAAARENVASELRSLSRSLPG